jgi:hypothetical protein
MDDIDEAESQPRRNIPTKRVHRRTMQLTCCILNIAYRVVTQVY